MFFPVALAISALDKGEAMSRRMICSAMSDSTPDSTLDFSWAASDVGMLSLMKWAEKVNALCGYALSASSFRSEKHAAEIVRHAQNDKLIVVDATNNNAVWYNLTLKVGEHIQQNWNRQANAADHPTIPAGWR